TPQEAQELFATLMSMAKEGHAVIFISHKLEEVMSATSNVTVLRAGRVVSTVETNKTSKEELAKMMVGREVLFRLEKAAVKTGEVVLKVENLHALRDNGLPALKGVSFSVREGEILGIAGVAGNGQSELAEVMTGLRRATDGRAYISGKDVTNLSSKRIIEHGVGHIPEDRINQGLIMDFTVTESAILDTHHMAPFSRGALLNFPEINSHVETLIKNFDVRCPSGKVLTKQLSGGNLQKLILAREISRDPKLLIAVNATTGLDVGATEYVHKKLEEQRERGKSILLISEDLDELIKLCDQLAVMYEGRIVGIVSAKEIDIDKIGLMMTGARRAE
ncbi:MAG: ABC transporter ATP-binding protein, partial [Candidatus Bathyarchaeia archaeon]